MYALINGFKKWTNFSVMSNGKVAGSMTLKHVYFTRKSEAITSESYCD